MDIPSVDQIEKDLQSGPTAIPGTVKWWLPYVSPHAIMVTASDDNRDRRYAAEQFHAEFTTCEQLRSVTKDAASVYTFEGADHA